MFLTIVSLVTKGISQTFLNGIKFVSTFLRQFLFHANNLLKREVNVKSWCSKNRRYMVTITFKRSRRQRKIKRLNKVVDEFSILINFQLQSTKRTKYREYKVSESTEQDYSCYITQK